MSGAFNTEIAVVAACMADPKCYWVVADFLVPEDFSDGRLQTIYRTMGARSRDNSAIDAVTMADELPQLGDFILGECLQEGWRAANVRGYAERVAANALVRRIRMAGQQIARLEGEGVLGEAQRLLAQCSPRNLNAVKHIGHFVKESYADILRKYEAGDAISGITTGVDKFDEMTCGWQPGDLIILAARPSVGKTALAMKHARAAAKADPSRAVLVFSQEMSGKQIADRAISAEGKINGTRLRAPKTMMEEDWPRLTNGIALTTDLPIYIDDTVGSTIEIICARARQQHAITPLQLIVIDYLQLIKPPKAETMSIAIGMISRALKQLARELGIPIICLSQLSREGANKRPDMSHLRASGDIEQDADVIIFLHRPNADVRTYLEWILAKQRNGETGDVALDADMTVMSFTVARFVPEGVQSRAFTAPDHFWNEVESDR